ncbi:MAG: SurA N-terminal domain-containing protein [Dehalococcoidia bacterium]
MAIAGALAAAAAVALVIWVFFGPSTEQQSVIEELATISRDPAGDLVVATVNGEPILRRSVLIMEAVGALGPRDQAGEARAPQTREEALQKNIEQVLFAQAALREGITVTEDEVSQTIFAGLTSHLQDPESQVADVLRATLLALRVPEAQAATHPVIRIVYARFVLAGRFGSAHPDLTYEQRVELAKKDAVIVIVPGALDDAPRPK